MKHLNSVIFAMIALSFGYSVESKAIELTALGGITYGNYSQKTSNVDVNWNSQVGYSFGALVSTNFLILPFDIESGLMYTTHSSQIALTQEQWKTHWLQIPLVARITLLDLIGFGAGVYVGFAQSTVDSTLTSGVTSNYNYEQKGLNKTDFGAVLNARLQVPVVPLAKVLLDVRYNYGFANLNSNTAAFPNDNFYNRFLMVLGGVSFGF